MKTEELIAGIEETLKRPTDPDIGAQLELAHLRAIRRKMRGEIRSLRRKLEDANRGAERRARVAWAEVAASAKVRRALKALIEACEWPAESQPGEFAARVAAAKEALR